MTTKIKKAGIGNLGAEESARLKDQLLTREDVKTQQDLLFENAAKAREQGKKKVEKLFIQAPAAQTRGAKLDQGARIEPLPEPRMLSLAKCASAEDLEKLASAADSEVAKHTSEFFEKRAYLTEAQKRYPELLKVAGSPDPKPTPTMKARSSEANNGPVATKSSPLGGAA